MERPIVDESLCFVCQELTLTHKITRGKETFLVCELCSRMIVSENDTNDRVKKSLYHTDTRGIFQMCLGVDLTQVRIAVEILDESELERARR